MTFNSWSFGVFFFIVYLVYLRLNCRQQNVFLLIASYFFYGLWDYRFVALLFISTWVDFIVGIKLENTQSKPWRRILLGASLTVNLGCLGFFKYCNFFVENLISLFASFGVEMSLSTINIILPVGISFYTFQTLGYAIDVFRGDIKACRNFANFALFVSFFPQLVAGPIERARHLIRQVELQRDLTIEQIQSGLWLVLKGYFLKVFISDNLSRMVDPIFANPDPSGVQSLMAIYAFAFQIYGDFAGYSNIARGVCKLMGFDLMINFKTPYLAVTPSDFWKRWHISLSTWLKDYLYIPLGGNRYGQLNTCRNLLITMVLGGLWHGAAWKYAFWGTYHGLILVIHRLATDFGWNIKLPRVFQTIFFFHITCFGWLIFRSESLQQLWYLPMKIINDFNWDVGAIRQVVALLFLVVPVVLLDVVEEFVMGADRFVRGHWIIQAVVYGSMFMLIYLFGSRGGNPFIYFQF